MIHFRNLTISLGILVLLASACKPRSVTPSLRDALIGEWVNQTLEVELRTYLGKDTTSHIHVTAQNWLETMKMAPIRTRLKRDGTFSSEYRTVTDSLFYFAEGNWEVKKDSLLMVFKPKMRKVSYHVEIKGQTATFTGILDWDQDGAADDLYMGTQRKTD
jgi:hypothetical protein